MRSILSAHSACAGNAHSRQLQSRFSPRIAGNSEAKTARLQQTPVHCGRVRPGRSQGLRRNRNAPGFGSWRNGIQSGVWEASFARTTSRCKRFVLRQRICSLLRHRAQSASLDTLGWPHFTGYDGGGAYSPWYLCRAKSTRGRLLPNVFPVLTFDWFPGCSMNSAPLRATRQGIVSWRFNETLGPEWTPMYGRPFRL